MKRNGIWGTNLEIMAISDMMNFDISIYTSLEQKFSDV